MLALWSTLSSIASFILMFWLYALDKAGKMSGRLPLWILAAAALIASLPLVFVVSEKVPDDLKWITRMATLAGLCLLYWGGMIWLSRTIVTPENVEIHLKEWAAYYQRPFTPTPGTFEQNYFTWTCTTAGGHRVGVMRPRNRAEDVILESIMVFTGPQQQLLDELPDQERVSLYHEVIAEILRADIHGEFGYPLRRLTILKAIPIRSDLRRQDFVAALDGVDRAQGILRNAIVAGLERRGAPVVQLPPGPQQHR